MIKQLNRVHPLSRGLKVCLTFQEFGGLLSNDAAYDNNALLSTTGARLNAKGLDLDGTNPGTTGAQIPYGYSKYLSGNDFNTVHIRFKINSFTNTPMLWSASGAANDYFLRYDASGSTLYFGNNSFRTYTPSIVIGVNEWHSITVVKFGAGDVASLYIDGVLQTNYSGTVASMTTTTNPLYVGRYAFVNTINLNGSVSHFYVYNRPMVLSEVRQLSSNPNAIFATSNISSLFIARNQNNFFRMFN